MSWTSPFTPVTNTIITSSSWNINARDNLTYLHDNSFILLSTTIESGSVSSVTFNPIGNFKNLRLVYDIQTSNVTNFVLTFNGDSGANYDQFDIGLLSNGVPSVSGNSSFAITDLITGFTNLGVAGQSISELWIPGWADTDKHKMIMGTAFTLYTTAYRIDRFSGWWRNTASITSITITCSSGNTDIHTGSVFSLYGG